ncbi:Uncharacterized conserved protein [Succinivibrio dextrinosolvens]|uniref:motility associated factor glycosyltransferase family protein n=1 Tax=Succinivibrio dextrinosolvens TaxID=83771 RepID=UPI0008F337A2|nr:6-hydroxymethylpterin diphosphokinase MptE-like protein [Succinivibrio dextrinosolvens]SFS46070.1 Uncharacterized conserved protein [Succinivibrio dextrinosolvens]
MADFNDKNISEEELDSFVALQCEMKHSLESRFKKNISSFRDYFPEIASFFETYTPSKKIDFVCGQNGIPNLFYSDTNEFIYNTHDPILYCKDIVTNYLKLPFNVSNYNPQVDFIGQISDKYLNECLKHIDNSARDKITFSELDTVPLCVVTGIGLGYIIGELYEKISVSTLVIVEQDPDVFFASLHTFDWAHFLNYIFSEHLSIDIVIDSCPINCFNTLSEIIKKRGCYLSCSLLSVIHYKNEFINEFSRLLQTKYEFIPNLLGFYDDYLFGVSHCCYALSSGKHFVISSPSIEEYAEYPVFLIGSGPSLDKDIQFIKQHENKAIVIACGTSIDSLYHTGINPDFFANTERISEIATLLNSLPDKNFLDDVMLLCSDVCHPIVQDIFSKTLFFGKINEPFFNYLRLIEDEFKEVQPISYMNPLVGNMGVAASLFLGFNNLYLFGFDNGKKCGTDSIHSKYASFFKKNESIEKRDSYKLVDIVPGNFGGECLTNSYYRMSMESISNIIEQFNNEDRRIQVVNCSDGSLIENTTPINSRELDNLFQNKTVLDKKKIRDFLFEKKSRTINFPRDRIKRILSYEEFSNLCSIVITKLEQLLPIETRQELYIRISELSLFLNTSSNPNEKFCKEMIESSLQSMFIEIFNASVLKKNFSDCLSVCRLTISLSIDFVRECEELYVHLPDYILGDHRKYFKDGKVGRDMPHCKAPLVT